MAVLPPSFRAVDAARRRGARHTRILSPAEAGHENERKTLIEMKILKFEKLGFLGSIIWCVGYVLEYKLVCWGVSMSAFGLWVPRFCLTS